MPRVALALALAAALAVPAFGVRAASLNFFTSAWFFGDSLSDDGNLFALTDEQLPPDPPYFQGRSSNGPVWAEHVAQDFEDKNLPTDNFAYAYAQAVTNDDLPLDRPQIPDLTAQIDRFAEVSPGRLGTRPLALVLIGSNDILNAMATNPPAPVAAGVAAANAAADGIGRLAGLGVKDYLVFSLPPIGKAPAFAGTLGEGPATLATDSYNATLAGRLASVPGVLNVDLHEAFLNLLADPGKYGLENATVPCFDPGPPASLCSPEEADKLAFYDKIHPNQVVHFEIAELARAQVAPVPLPAPLALLGAGIAGLALAGRRRRG